MKMRNMLRFIDRRRRRSRRGMDSINVGTASAGDDEFQALFGECEDADEIEQIRDNEPGFDEFCPADIEELSEASFEKLGSYIAGNDYLRKLDLSCCELDDSKMASLFRGLTQCETLTSINLRQNRFGLNGVRSMVPFLKSSPNVLSECVSRGYFDENVGINAECFGLLLEAVAGAGSIEFLHFDGCNIESLAALERYTLPKLRFLWLRGNRITDIPSQTFVNYTCLKWLDLTGNKIGESGFQAIANSLQKEGCGLERVFIQSTGMGDAGAKILADSLRCNKKLESLDVSDNEIGDGGWRAFLKLLTDVSSIKSTESSNHKLSHMGIPLLSQSQINCMRGIFRTEEGEQESWESFCKDNPHAAVIGCIRYALIINLRHGQKADAADAAKKEKVREMLLPGPMRSKIARLQGIKCPSYYQLFFDLDPVLLPEVLALLGASNPSDLHQTVLAKASDLISLIDRKAMLRGETAKNEARIAALSAQISAMTAEVAELRDANSRMGKTLTELEDQTCIQLSGMKGIGMIAKLFR